MDTFRLVLLVRSGDAGPLATELVQSGYPLQRATSPADAVRLAGLGPCFLCLDAVNAPKLGTDTLPTLTPLVQSGSVRVCVLEPVAEPLAIGALVAKHVSSVDELAQLMWMNQRASPRAEVILQASYLTTDGTVRDGTVRSLSEGGAMFVSQDPPAMNASGLLRITDSEGQLLELDAQVVNERKMEKGAGLRFIEPEASAMEHLRRLVTGALGIGAKRAAEHPIAVYDPSALVRKVAASVLGVAGYDVLECATLPELMRVVSGAVAPTALLLDPLVQSLSGDRLKDVVKRAGAKTKVVFHAGAAEEAVKKAQAATGVQLVVKKGTFADVLIGRVGSIIAG